MSKFWEKMMKILSLHLSIFLKKMMKFPVSLILKKVNLDNYLKKGLKYLKNSTGASQIKFFFSF